ncbi:uncharacterized protein LOC143859136 [Tasmannia lanceolata]|uniref:uncharacterized protein LOC143859136 n=1 Tax=Tasmannia lanceolata TaxID=3420 RepID=UPI004064A1A0
MCYSVLDGLGHEFLLILQQILGLSTLPDLDEVFSRVQQALSVDAPSDTIVEQSTMAVQTGSGRGTRGRRGYGRGFGRDSWGGRSTGGCGSRYCSHCDMEGHTVDFCYDLHPELSPSRSEHYVSETPTAVPTDFSDTVVVSQSEYESLLRQQDKGKHATANLATESSTPSCSLSHSTSWLIDFGVSHHMTGSSDWEEDWFMS